MHVICTRLRPGHLSKSVGDSSWRTEEIVKISNSAFQCDYCYYIIIIIHLSPLACRKTHASKPNILTNISSYSYRNSRNQYQSTRIFSTQTDLFSNILFLTLECRESRIQTEVVTTSRGLPRSPVRKSGDNTSSSSSAILCKRQLQMNNLPFLYDSSANGTRALLLFVDCLTSQQQASVSQGRICSDNFACCHTEVETAGQTFYLTQSQYTDTGPISLSADPIMPGAWPGSHWSANV